MKDKIKALGLHSPTGVGASKAVAYIAVACVVIYLLRTMGVLTPWLASALILGIAGAEVASAFGVSYRRQGVTALLLVCASSAILAFVVLLIGQAFGVVSHILS